MDKRILPMDRLSIWASVIFKESMQGRSALSCRLEDKISGGSIIVYSVPVYKDNKVCAVLFATYSVVELQKVLQVSVFNGEGYTYVIEQNGDAVIDSISETGFAGFENI